MGRRADQLIGLFGYTSSCCCIGFYGLAPFWSILRASLHVASSVFGVTQSIGGKCLGSRLTGRKSDSPLIYSLRSGRSWALESSSQAVMASVFSMVWLTGSRVSSSTLLGAICRLKRLIRAYTIGILRRHGPTPLKTVSSVLGPLPFPLAACFPVRELAIMLEKRADRI
jgi:hypothetical protein